MDKSLWRGTYLGRISDTLSCQIQPRLRFGKLNIKIEKEHPPQTVAFRHDVVPEEPVSREKQMYRCKYKQSKLVACGAYEILSDTNQLSLFLIPRSV
jgi:hypothetical protein